MSRTVRFQRVTEPTRLRDRPFELAFARVVRQLRASGGLEGLLVDDSASAWALGDKPLVEFYGRGSVAL